MRQTLYVDIIVDNLMEEMMRIKSEGYRLVQISATTVEHGVELLYSFGKEYELLCLRLNIEEGTTLMSISSIFAPAFLYENEIHDLFGVPITLLTADYKGNLYRTGEQSPFKPKGKTV